MGKGAKLSSLLKDVSSKIKPVLQEDSQLSLFSNNEIQRSPIWKSNMYRNQKGQFRNLNKLNDIPIIKHSIPPDYQPKLFTDNMPKEQSNYHMLFSEKGGPLKSGAGAVGNSIYNGLFDQGWKNWASDFSPALAGGLVGGVSSYLGNLAFPNSVQYEGMVSPILKGMALGAGAGLISRHGIPSLTSKFSHNTGMVDKLTKTKNILDSKLTMGAIMAGTMAGTGNISLTRPLNEVRDRY